MDKRQFLAGSAAFAGATVTWSASNGATHYALWVDELDESGQIISSQVSNEQFILRTSHTLSGLHGHFRLWVRALRAESGEIYASHWSRAVEFTGR